jgi:hypothetical protein
MSDQNTYQLFENHIHIWSESLKEVAEINTLTAQANDLIVEIEKRKYLTQIKINTNK